MPLNSLRGVAGRGLSPLSGWTLDESTGLYIPEGVLVTYGAIHTTDGAMAVKITTSGGYTYVGEAHPGSLESEPIWRCARIDSTGTTLWADGDGDFDNVASDLTALSYS